MAVEYIDRHLKDVNMTVARIAQELGINATYLAHLFSEQMGIRMHQHIADLRVKMAKELLTSTNWQVKRVAYESGHANADWFSQIFRAHTGLTPSRYRRQHRAQRTAM